MWVVTDLSVISRIRRTGSDFEISDNVLSSDAFKSLIEGEGHRIVVPITTKIGSLRLEVKGKGNTIIIGENCALNGEIKVRGTGSSIFIGAGTTIGRATIQALEDNVKIQLGEDCMLSHGVYISTSDSHSIIDTLSGKRINPAKNITIGKHVWLGMGTYIAKGSAIGDNSLAAAHAVVTKQFPNNVAIAGNPAKIIRENVTWDRKLIPID